MTPTKKFRSKRDFFVLVLLLNVSMSLSRIKGSNSSLEMLIFSLLTISLISFLHSLALNNYFYWLYWWFDVLMHFLGGFWVGMTSLWIFFFSGIFKTHFLTKRNLLLVASVSVIVWGVSWEVFESVVWQTFKDPNFLFDSIIDILLDFLGGFIAYRYFVFNFLENKNV